MLGVVDMYICKSTKYSEFEEDLIKVSTYHLCKSIEEYEFIYKKMRSNAI